MNDVEINKKSCTQNKIKNYFTKNCGTHYNNEKKKQTKYIRKPKCRIALHYIDLIHSFSKSVFELCVCVYLLHACPSVFVFRAQ